MTVEIGKGAKSFWGPYFDTAQECELPCFWEIDELEELEDELLKTEILEYREEFENEYQVLQEIAAAYSDKIDAESFTWQNFKKAFTMCVTRCFGWSLPHTSVIPLADCANHFIIDNQYEMF